MRSSKAHFLSCIHIGPYILSFIVDIFLDYLFSIVSHMYTYDHQNDKDFFPSSRFNSHKEPHAFKI